ncbi:STAS domain-containing protein [Bacillus sp. FJAT-18017]|uniref:STAS domain-containing protein n=1 Tax=Bacillus sp. FJAT-18017 TaxID=1705566 RepID=UPI0006AF82B8|nr:STAS domain-containing protein [Bacillus sp. FJAT-18017]
MYDFSGVINRIREIKVDLANEITDKQVEKYPEQLGPISEQLRKERVNLIGLYEELLVDDLDTALAKIEEWGKKTGAYCYELGMTIDMALDELNYYREEMTEIIYELGQKNEISLSNYHEANKKLQRIIDKAAQSFSIAFVAHHKDMMKKAQREIEELSVPVVPLEDGVAVLPLVGTIDTYRAKLLMEESLRKSAQLGVTYFIVDLSGVPIVDTMVANQIFQVIDALRLLGVQAVLSGIRPEIAQTMVLLGIDTSRINTFSSLQQALQSYRLTHPAAM